MSGLSRQLDARASAWTFICLPWWQVCFGVIILVASNTWMLEGDAECGMMSRTPLLSQNPRLDTEMGSPTMGGSVRVGCV
jgi:hypothetical protein